MEGRESRLANDVFFACSLIDYIGRKTKNRRCDVVNALGRERVGRLVELADVYHSEDIDAVADRFSEESDLATGRFDNVGQAHFAIPSHWDIGKVYKRLVLGIMGSEETSAEEAILRAYNSFVSPLIDDYDGSFFYENPDAILDAYLTGELD